MPPGLDWVLPDEEHAMPDPHLRAADSDRAAVAATLGRAMTDGRLSIAEYDERLAAAYASRAYGELAALTADLPSAGVPAPPAAVDRAEAAPPVPADAGPDRSLRAAWSSWASTALIVLSIWAVTSIVAQEFLYL